MEATFCLGFSTPDCIRGYKYLTPSGYDIWKINPAADY